MTTAATSDKQDWLTVKNLRRRAEAILKARPAYREMVDFYLEVFSRQIEWRDRLVVRPDEVPAEQARDCLREGTPLIERYDPGIDGESLLNLWAEMKTVFRQGNKVLRGAIKQIDDAEGAGYFTPVTWLLEQRPDRYEAVTETSGRIGVAESVLATLARATTFPHWKLVADKWLPQGDLEEWKRSCCPTCGGLPGLAEIRKGSKGSDGVTRGSRRLMHCPFCGSCWTVQTLKCPACASAKPGDAKYLFADQEPDLRIDFCNSCHHYIKVIDGDSVPGRIHIGLELLTAAHLDVIARDKKLSPLEIRE